MPIYIAVVKVEPPGTAINFANAEQPLEVQHRLDQESAQIRFLTAKGEIIAVHFTTNWDAPLSQIRVLTAYYVQRLYAVASLLSNHFIQTFVVSVTNVETGRHEAFRESWPINDVYADAIATNPDHLNSVFQLGLTNAYLSIALEDMRLATGHLWSGPFFCYRAVESIRQHFRVLDDGDNKAPSWGRMRAALHLQEPYTRFLADAANPIRHGDAIRIDVGLSIQCLDHARNIVFRFIEFLRVGTLDGDLYPMLAEE